MAVVLTGCGGGVDNALLGDDVNQAEMGGDVNEETRNKKQETRDGDGELRVFVLEIDEELFDVEMPEQTEYTAFDVLKFYAEEHGVVLKVKEYDFGIFVEGIGDKIGDKNNFWLYYVNDKPANASADMVEVKPGDVIKFEWTSNDPF